MSAQVILLPNTPEVPPSDKAGYVTVDYYIKTAKLAEDRAKHITRLESRIKLLANRSIELRKVAFALATHDHPRSKQLELDIERIADVIETLAVTTR